MSGGFLIEALTAMPPIYVWTYYTPYVVLKFIEEEPKP